MQHETPTWYTALVGEIAVRIENICALYDASARTVVLTSVIRAFHAKADELDPSETWIHLALGSADLTPADLAAAGSSPAPSLADHPSLGDARDLAEDIAAMATPLGLNSPAVAIRAAVLVAWTRFASTMPTSDRALLAIEAAKLA